ncbi:MAG: hypothetical protein JXB07_12715 [Anaerolineae bacterium]|nr:hypothetical protein [Anaerolineae bacterium]
MATSSVLPAFNAFPDYLVEKATPQEILAFSVPPEGQERAGELLDRQNAGVLTPIEAIGLERMREFDRLVSLLKAKALARMQKQ